MGVVYILHLTQPLPRGISPTGTYLEAGHYMGFTIDLIRRIFEHSDGKGARFMEVCVERGITFALARTWEGDNITRTTERKLKNFKNTPKLCPICNPQAMHHMTLERLL